MKKLSFSLLIIILLPLCLRAQQPLSGADSARRIIDTLINYAQKNSIYRNRVNWTKLTDSVKKHSAGAQSVKEAMPSVALFYELLGDFHGFVTYNRRTYKWRKPTPKLDTVKYKSLIAKYKSNPVVESRPLEKDYGYVLIPANYLNKPGQTDSLAQFIQDSFLKLKPGQLKGIVIDLRPNTGGNMHPMILGLRSLLGDGQFGSFIDPVSGNKSAWGLKGNIAYVDRDTTCRLQKTAPLYTNLKVVVLVGPYTASSGEATAITFAGRKNTIIMGEKSAGYTTANESFAFLNTGIFMATAAEADRNGKVYYDYVFPHQEVTGADNFTDLLKDAKIIAALKWLKGK